MQAAPSRPITVSIVSHGQQVLAIQLIEQLAQHCAQWIDKVVLTTNIPEPAPSAGHAWRLPVETIRNPRPQGFGANHNAAFAACRSPWFLVLNPDICIETDVLGTLLAQAQARDGVLAPRIVEPGSRHCGPEPHRALLTPCEILTRNRANYQAPARPAWIAGMFMLLRKQAYQQVQGFDDRYFMYGEDFDICARLRLAGWQIRIGESLQVQHDARRASRKDRRHLRWHFASLARVWLSPAFWRYRSLLVRDRGNSGGAH